MVNDPISDMLTRIKNAYLARKASVAMPVSNMKVAMAELLKKEQYIESFEIQKAEPCSQLVLTLRYVGKRAALTDIKRMSKPGRRMYTRASEAVRTLGGYGITVISTSQGLMNDKDARAKRVGGEVICKVW